MSGETLLLVVSGLTQQHLASLPCVERDGVWLYDPIAAYDSAAAGQPLAKPKQARTKPPSWEVMAQAAPDYIEEDGKRYCTVSVAARLASLSPTQIKLLARQNRIENIRRRTRKAGSASVYLLVASVEEYAQKVSRKARRKPCNAAQSAINPLF